MKRVSIRRLHETTEKSVRLAKMHEQIIITERGRPIAAVAPVRTPAKRSRFHARRVLPAYKKLRGKVTAGTDSGLILSGDR